jgi:acyl carrier protein
METMEEIKNKIRDYIIESTYAAPDSVKDDSLIFVEGIFDSMGFILLINFIEESFGIKAKDSELLEDNFESIDAISRFVAGKVAQAA